MALSSSLAARCGNLGNFCSVLDKYWWCLPLATLMMGRLTDAAKDDIRPLLGLRHVTPERAKKMIKMGLSTVRDVATIDPPEILSQKIKFLSKWRAVEMVLDSRMQIAQEALLLAAESRDRQNALNNIK